MSLIVLHTTTGCGIRIGDVIVNSGKRYSMVMDVDRDGSPYSDKITCKELNLSRWAIIRNFQLKIIRKVFSTKKPTK